MSYGVEHAPSLSDNSQWCPSCGAQLEVSTDWLGGIVEWCANGCVAPRPVVRRRVPCPKCGGGHWDAEGGCGECGHGVPVRLRQNTFGLGGKICSDDPMGDAG